jgi:S-DNA-T family DNA segregation ATPase FtsK/SpoIIIE
MTLVVQGQSRAVATAAAAPLLPSRFRPLSRRRVLRAEQHQRRRDQNLAWRAQEVFAGLGLVTGQASIAAGQTVSIPHVVRVDVGPPVSLVVRILPGQVVGDFAEQSSRIAANLGVARVRVVSLGPSLLRFELLESDPLRESIELPRRPLADPTDLLLLGVDDVGNRYQSSPVDLVHLAIQGSTGSGKSIFTYGLLAQLVRCPNVLIGMSDPTGLLARPFQGTVHAEWMTSGTANPDDHADSLERLVELMDQRIAMLPPRRDQVEIDEGCPLLFYVLEEYPGLLRAADDGKRSGGRVDRIKLLVSRLISEGRKAGIRLVLLAQRFEAAIVDGFTRDQCTVRMSFRVGNATSIEMLHPTGRAAAEEHAVSPPGVALLSAPGVPLVRLKSPYLGHDDDDTAYGRYWDLICAHAARLPVYSP